MSRKREATGVGRGNGAGSRKTQFKDGMPSGNPKGRPRKKPPPQSTCFNQAMMQALSELVTVQLGDGRTAQIPMFDAMARKCINDFPRASFREKIAFLRAFREVMPAGDAQAHRPSDETIATVLERLAKEAGP